MSKSPYPEIWHPNAAPRAVSATLFDFGTIEPPRAIPSRQDRENLQTPAPEEIFDIDEYVLSGYSRPQTSLSFRNHVSKVRSKSPEQNVSSREAYAFQHPEEDAREQLGLPIDHNRSVSRCHFDHLPVLESKRNLLSAPPRRSIERMASAKSRPTTGKRTLQSPMNDRSPSELRIDPQRLFEITHKFLEENGLVFTEGVSKQQIKKPRELSAEETVIQSVNAQHQKRGGIQFEQDQVLEKMHHEFMRYVKKHIKEQSIVKHRPMSSAFYRSTASASDSEGETESGRTSVARTSVTRPRSSVTRASTARNSTTRNSTTRSSVTRTSTTRKEEKPEPTPETEKKKRPSSGKIIIQSRARPFMITPEQADTVRHFLQFEHPFAENRKNREKTLADWVTDHQGKEPIWNAKLFSVKKYIMLYVKSQAAEEEAQKVKIPKVVAPVGIGMNARLSKSRAGLKASGANLLVDAGPRIPRRNGSASSLLGMRAQFLLAHPETSAPFHKTAFARTPEDLKFLFKAVRGIKAFKDLSDFILGQVCGVLRYQEYEQNRAVFKQGDTGTAWYIILSGTVSVQISKTGQIEDSFQVATLSAGSGFGDLALVNDKPRAATILTLTYCELCVVEKSDYNRIIKFIHEKDMKEKIYFLRKIPLFSEWSATQLRQIGQVIKWQKYAPGTIIQHEGQATKEFMIIRSGSCQVYRDLQEGGKTVRVRVGYLHALECFGEEGVLWEDVSEDAEKSHVEPARSTIMVGNDEAGVEIAVMTCFDARAKFKNDLTMNPIHDKSPADLMRLHHDEVQKKVWERERRITVDRMVREKYHDPNLTAFKLMEMSSVDKHWRY